MTRQEALERISAIEAEVRENWRADDGGLTMAASDLLSKAAAIRLEIQAGYKSGLKNLDHFKADTGLEAELIDVALEWATGD